MIRQISLGVIIGVILSSVIMDLTTYNVIFETTRPLLLYVLDGITFNFDKTIIWWFILLGSEIYESPIISIRQQISKSSNNENINLSQIKG